MKGEKKVSKAEQGRRMYGVPARRGQRVRSLYEKHREGTIVQFAPRSHNYIVIRYDDTKKTRVNYILDVEYLLEDGTWFEMKSGETPVDKFWERTNEKSFQRAWERGFNQMMAEG